MTNHIKNIDALVEAGKDAPSMSEILDAQTEARTKANISITEKGRELATIDHILAALKLQNLEDRSKPFYEAAHQALPSLEWLLAENKRMQWQPIETAPKDGYEVFLVTGKTEQPCVVTRSAKNWRDIGHPFAAFHTGAVFHENKFTHWIPLPTPPTFDEREGGD